MTRLQNIMESLEPAVMGKVEEVIDKHDLKWKEEKKDNESNVYYFDHISDLADEAQRIRNRYGDLRSMLSNVSGTSGLVAGVQADTRYAQFGAAAFVTGYGLLGIGL